MRRVVFRGHIPVGGVLVNQEKKKEDKAKCRLNEEVAGEGNLEETYSETLTPESSLFSKDMVKNKNLRSIEEGGEKKKS
jgi:hypothetical protein